MQTVGNFVLFKNVVVDVEQHAAVDKAISKDVTVHTKRLAADLSVCHYVVLQRINYITGSELTLNVPIGKPCRQTILKLEFCCCHPHPQTCHGNLEQQGESFA